MLRPLGPYVVHAYMRRLKIGPLQWCTLGAHGMARTFASIEEACNWMTLQRARGAIPANVRCRIRRPK